MCQTNTFIYAVILDKEHEVEIPTISKDLVEQFKKDIEMLKFENAKSIKDCEWCKIREFCKDFDDGGVHTCQEVYQIYLQSKEK